MSSDNRNTLYTGTAGSGKTELAIRRLLPRLTEKNLAIVVIDPQPTGMLARKVGCLAMLRRQWHRVLYDRLADTEAVPAYGVLRASTNPDPFQRDAENDEAISEMISIIMRREGKIDASKNANIEDGLRAALSVFIYQDRPCPFPWLARIFREGTPEQAYLLAHCTEPRHAEKIRWYSGLAPSQWEYRCGPGERRLEALSRSPAFALRSGTPTFDYDGFLDAGGIHILDGMARGNLSRDALSIVAGATVLRVISKCRNGCLKRVLLLIDEGINAGILDLHIARALAEARQWDLQIEILVQSPLSIPEGPIRDNVLMNCALQCWCQQNDPRAAFLGAELIGTPTLDPLKVHHTEARTRQVHDGYEFDKTTSTGVSKDKQGKTLSKDKRENEVARARYRQEVEYQDRYTTYDDQVKDIQSALMQLGPGWHFAYERGQNVSTTPVYQPMVDIPWFRLFLRDGKQKILLADKKLNDALAAMRRGPAFRPPSREAPPAPEPADTIPIPSTRRAGKGMRRSSG